jgi:hypothetical protein
MKAKDKFQRIDDKYANGTSWLMQREYDSSKYMNTFIGDFLSRIWYLYGAPEGEMYEGFQYTFKHVETGLLFTAYSAGSGPAYGGNDKKKKKLLPVITEFDEMLNKSKNADCEISIETDFGTYKVGAKNGKPFQRAKRSKTE